LHRFRKILQAITTAFCGVNARKDRVQLIYY
jgi:hypothetical protein